MGLIAAFNERDARCSLIKGNIIAGAFTLTNVAKDKSLLWYHK